MDAQAPKWLERESASVSTLIMMTVGLEKNKELGVTGEQLVREANITQEIGERARIMTQLVATEAGGRKTMSLLAGRPHIHPLNQL